MGDTHDAVSLKAFEEVGRLAAENEKLRADVQKYRNCSPLLIYPGVTSTRMSILKDWVTELGLRHQGVLLTVIRGCDTAPKDDASNLLTRSIRAVLLNPHCGDAKKAATFIEYVEDGELNIRFDAFRRNLDHYPHHYVMHVMHAIEIIGYLHPDQSIRDMWGRFYFMLCKGLHVNSESRVQLNERLDADEETFVRRD